MSRRDIGVPNHMPMSADRLHFGVAKSIPEGAVRISEDEALKLQVRAMHSWEPQKDMAALKYGSYIFGSMSAISGIILNNNVRRYLNLSTFGRGATFLPTVILPTVVSIIAHQDGVVKPLMLGDFDCPVCLQVRSASYQVVCGLMYPMLMAPLTGSLIARQYHLYKVPKVSDWRAISKYLQKMMTRQSTVLLGLLAIQVIGANVITGLEGVSFIKLMGDKLKTQYE